MGRPWYKRAWDCTIDQKCRRRKMAGAKREVQDGIGDLAGGAAAFICGTGASLTGSPTLTLEASRRCRKGFRNTFQANADRTYHDDRLEIRFGKKYVCAPSERKSRKTLDSSYQGDAGLNCSADKSPSQGGCHCSTRNDIPVVCGGEVSQMSRGLLTPSLKSQLERLGAKQFVDRVFADPRLMGYLCMLKQSTAPLVQDADDALGGLLGDIGGFVEDSALIERQDVDEALGGFL